MAFFYALCLLQHFSRIACQTRNSSPTINIFAIQQLQMSINTGPVVVSRVFAAPAHRLWTALTNKDEMKLWYFDLAAFEPRVGFHFSFTGGPPDKVYVHLCDITEAIPERRLAHTWRYEGYSGSSTVIWELTPVAEGTLLTLTHTGLETFPADNPDLAAHNFETGWNAIIHQNLTRYLGLS
jgi:uncharacterized protein YndB with AHSA1/START domain